MVGSLKGGISRMLDWVAENSPSEGVQRRRLRFVSGTLLVLWVVSLGLGPVYAYTQGISSLPAIACFSSACLNLVLLWYIRRWGRHELPGIVITANLLFALFYTGFEGESEVAGKIAWFTVAPAMANFISGPRKGMFFMALTALAIVVGHFWLPDLGQLSMEGMLAVLTAVVFSGILGRLYEHFIQEDALQIARSHAVVASALEEAKAANRAKSSFLANMSHEIRTPLHGVIGLLKLLNEEKLSAQDREYVRFARSSAGALLGIVSDVLDLSKIEAGETRREHIPYGPQQLIEETVGAHAATLHEGVGLDWELSTELPERLMGDPTRIRQVLSNLINNATKFTRNGEIRVRLSCSPDRTRIRFEVRDTGIGIPEHRLHAIFEPFTQVDDSTTRRFGGTGLGLNLCRQICDLLGGEIGVQSEENVGSTFWFELPSEIPPQGVSESGASQSRSKGRQALRLLVAEDNPVNRLVITKTLARLGHDVTVVEEGASAVEAVAVNDFDAVLMDLHMPIMDGFQACAAIRKLPGPAAKILIFALTASVLESDRQRCREIGMDDFLGKPLQPGELERALAKAAAGQHASAA